MKGKWILIILVAVFLITTLNPYASWSIYWSIMHLARTFTVLLIGVVIGYFLAKVSD
jgi:hypothetical protein